MSHVVPVSLLHELFLYDPETGLLTRKITQQYQPAGKVCDKPGDRRGHLAVTVKRKGIYIHRIAWAMHYGEWPSGHVDHINRIPNDNRIVNLRLATNSENQQNRAPYANSRTGVTGVSFHKGKWRARIEVNGAALHLGRFDNIADAIEARRIAESEFHPRAPTDIPLPKIDVLPTGAARTYVVRKIRRLPFDEAVRIAALRLQGVPCKEIAEKFGCSESYPREIVFGRTRPEVLSAARKFLHTAEA